MDYPLAETYTKRDTRVPKAVKTTGASLQLSAKQLFPMSCEHVLIGTMGEILGSLYRLLLHTRGHRQPKPEGLRLWSKTSRLITIFKKAASQTRSLGDGQESIYLLTVQVILIVTKVGKPWG